MAHPDCETDDFEVLKLKVGDLVQVSNTGYPIAGYYQCTSVEPVGNRTLTYREELHVKHGGKPPKWDVLFRKVFTSGMSPINGKEVSSWGQWIPVTKDELIGKLENKQRKLLKAYKHLESL